MTLQNWLNEQITKRELTNDDFKQSKSVIAAYRNSRVFPKYEVYASICEVLKLLPCRKQYDMFGENFKRNGKR